MNKILSPNCKLAVVCLDDIMVLCWSLEDQICDVKAVLQRIRDQRLCLNGEKCEVRVQSRLFIGYSISTEGIDTEAKMIIGICSWPVPQSVAELLLFLGLAGYYRRFVGKSVYKCSYLDNLVNEKVRLKRVPFK
jgi:hypothetical protein